MRILKDIINTKQPDFSYPKGNIRNKDTGALPPEDGTPVVEEVYGDIIQFHQRLAELSETTENDLPDNKTNGYQLLQAFRNVFMKKTVFNEIDNTAFPCTVGVDARATGISDSMLVAVNETDKELQAYRFISNNSLLAIGTPLTIANGNGIEICNISFNVIAVTDDIANDIRVYEYSGTGKATTGTWALKATLAAPGISAPGVCKLSENIFAVANFAVSSWKIYQYNGVDTITEIASPSVPNHVLGVYNISDMAKNRVGMMTRANSGSDKLQVFELDPDNSYAMTEVANYDVPYNVFDEVFVAINDTDVLLRIEEANGCIQFRVDGNSFRELSGRYWVPGSITHSLDKMPNGNIICLYYDNVLAILQRTILC